MKIKQFPSAILTEKQLNEMSLIGADRYFILHDRQKAIRVMKALYEKGYRWIARCSDSDSLMLYNLKPKKYMDMQIWGYTDSDLRCGKTMMAESIKNEDITEIRWENRQPTDLWQFIKDNEVGEWN